MILNEGSMKRQLCQILYKIGALRFGTFKLTSGETSPYYIDLRLVPSFPVAFHKTCDIYLDLIKANLELEAFKIIAGVPTGGVPFASVIAYKLDKPLLYTRHAQRKHGRERRVEGTLMPGDKALLLDDLATSGKSLLEAASAIRSEGGVVTDAVVLIDREEGGKEALSENGVVLHSLLKTSEVANTLHEAGVITRTEMDTILKQRR